MKFLVGTLCGGLMEDPELYIQPPYLIIDAKAKEKPLIDTMERPTHISSMEV